MMATIEEPYFSETPREKFLQAVDDSMAPTIEIGDIMLVDTAVDRIFTDAVFVLCMDEHPTYPYIRRVQRLLDDGFALNADNDVYENERVTNLEDAGVRVLGRVTKVWKNIQL